MGKLLLIAGLALAFWLWWRSWKRMPSMPLGEARALLGVGDDADAGAIREAHRRIIARVHPDAGGTAELARRTNLARDLLLAEAARRSPSTH